MVLSSSPGSLFAKVCEHAVSMHHVIASCEPVPSALLPPRRVPDAVQWWRRARAAYLLCKAPARPQIGSQYCGPTPRPPPSLRAPRGNAAAASVTWHTIANCSAARGKWWVYRRRTRGSSEAAQLLRHPAPSPEASALETPDMRARQHRLDEPQLVPLCRGCVWAEW